MTRTILACCALFFVAATGCATANIEGTMVPDTEENREVVELLEKLRHSMETRDGEAITAMVSSRYFEDMGTVDTSDDYGYQELVEKILPQTLDVTKELYVSFTVHSVEIEEPLARADIRYSSRARLDLPSGTQWDSHKEFNQVTFTRENGRWMVLSGL